MEKNKKTCSFIFHQLTITLFFCLSCSGKTDDYNLKAVEIIKPVIISVVPHDPSAFTQGLVYHGGKLYESTGIYGRSSIRIVDTSGVVLQSRSVPGFAEGCAFLNEKLYQLTWKEQVCFVYDESLRVTGEFSYGGEGWGLTSDPSGLIMSNGSDTLYFRDSQMRIVKRASVKKDGVPVKNLNELEYVNGKVYANVWFSDFVFEISPSDGTVLRIVDCSDLVAVEKPGSEENVLNGIAFVQSSGLFYITGKNWKNLFLVKIP